MKFKIILTYENYSFEETLQVEAESIQKARQKCEEIKIKNQELIEKLKTKNIFISKQIKDCRLCSLDWRDELKETLDSKLDLRSKDDI